MTEPSKRAKLLEAQCFDAVLERIKEATKDLEATFACGGSVKCSQPVRIFFSKDGSRTAEEVKPVEGLLLVLP